MCMYRVKPLTLAMCCICPQRVPRYTSSSPIGLHPWKRLAILASSCPIRLYLLSKKPLSPVHVTKAASSSQSRSWWPKAAVRCPEGLLCSFPWPGMDACEPQPNHCDKSFFINGEHMSPHLLSSSFPRISSIQAPVVEHACNQLLPLVSSRICTADRLAFAHSTASRL